MADGDDVVQIATITQPGYNRSNQEVEDAAVNRLFYSRKAGMFYVERTHRPGYFASSLDLGRHTEMNKPGRWGVTAKQMQRFMKMAKREEHLAKVSRVLVSEMKTALSRR